MADDLLDYAFHSHASFIEQQPSQDLPFHMLHQPDAINSWWITALWLERGSRLHVSKLLSFTDDSRNHTTASVSYSRVIKNLIPGSRVKETTGSHISLGSGYKKITNRNETETATSKNETETRHDW